MAREIVWNFFVDESGDFTKLQDKVVVAGVGLRVDRFLSRSDEIRRNIQNLFPGIVWPPHNAIVKKPSALALSVMALRWRAILDVVNTCRRSLARAMESSHDAAVTGSAAQQVLERIREVAGHGLAVPFESFIRDYEAQLKALLSEVADPKKTSSTLPDVPQEMWAPGELWEEPQKWSAAIEASRIMLTTDPERTIRTVRALANGRDPKYCDLESLDLVLKGHSVYWHLCGQVVQGIASFRRILQRLAQADETGLPGAFVCFAGESRPGDFNPPDSERYLSILQAMLTRVAEALSRWRDKHTVRLYVCHISVTDPWIGGPRLVPLHFRHLSRALGSIQPKIWQTVRFVTMEVEQYRYTQDPGYVLADFFASVARGAVGNRDLKRLESLVQAGAGVLPRSEGRTHVQAAGTAWVMLEGLRRGDPISADDRLWRWAFEQALEWGTGTG